MTGLGQLVLFMFGIIYGKTYANILVDKTVKVNGPD